MKNASSDLGHLNFVHMHIYIYIYACSQFYKIQLEGREAARKLVLQKGIEFKEPDPNQIQSPASFFEFENRPGKPISSVGKSIL